MAKAGYAIGRRIPLRAPRRRRASRTPIPPRTRWRVVAAAQLAGIGLTLLPVFYAHGGLRRHCRRRAGQRRFVHTPHTLRSASFERLTRARDAARLRARHRAAQPARRDARGARAGRALRGAGCADPHPRRGADARGRRLLRLEPHAAGRVAPDAGGRRPALVPRARDAHDRARSRRARRRAARSRASRRPPKPISATARFPAEPTSRKGGRFGVGSDSNTVIDPVRRAAPARVVAAAARCAGATCCAATASCTIGNALWHAAAQRRRAGAGPARPAPSQPGVRADLVVLERRTMPRWPSNRPTTCSTPRSSDRRASPCATSMSGGRWIVRDGRHARGRGGRSRAIARRSRACGERVHAIRRRPRCSVDAHVATMQRRRAGTALLTDGAIGDAWRRDRVGRPAMRDLPRDARRRANVSCLPGIWLTPGLVDCHTHLVYAGNRAHEFERRLSRARPTPTSHAKAAASRRTVRATRAASEDELAAQSAPRLAALAAEGVTTVEIKSGYGLDTATELKQLRVARELGADARASTCARRCSPRTRLPPEFAGRATTTSTTCAATRSPPSRATGLADAVDAFCESDRLHAGADACAFSRRRARTALRVKLHADQLSDLGRRARSRREVGALSADHLEYTSDAGVEAMARGRHGRGAAARRVLRAARNAAAADRGAARGRRADGDRHRLQSGHVARDVARR